MLPSAIAVPYSLGTVGRALAYLRGVPELSSAILYVTAGVDVDLNKASPELMGRDSSISGHEEAVTFIEQLGKLAGDGYVAGIPVYPISPVGLNPVSAIGASSSLRSDFFRIIAHATGGRAVVDTNTPVEAIPGIFAENGFRYIIGFRATYPRSDGHYRRLVVQVNRPKTVVEPSDHIFSESAASGVSGDKSIAATTRALSGLVPRSEQALRLALASFAASTESPRTGMPATIVVALGVDLTREEAATMSIDTIELETRVFDGEGRKQLNVRQQRAQLTVQPGAETGQYDLLSVLPLTPGRYNLRFSIHSAARARAGSVYTDVTVPDYAKLPVSMSGVVVGVVPGRTAVASTTVSGVLPLLPTTQRAFANSDRVTAFVRIYSGGRVSETPVVITASVIDEKNATVFQRTDAVILAGRPPLRNADYRIDVPVAHLTAGEYLLTLRTAPTKGAAVQRTVRFIIR
jgi:hypothetical protein